MFNFRETNLWKAAFAVDKSDPTYEGRDRLRNALERMRENVSQLLTMVPVDCKDLTVHDVSHLDALWEMSALLAGDDSDLNPAETFVLGASILLHDAGLTTASYPGGLVEIKETIEWRDTAASFLRSNGLEVTETLISEPPLNLLPIIKFAVLRALHAKQAEVMVSRFWTKPNGEQLFLLEDPDLRAAFGSSIGRIAHSHHWNADKLPEKLIGNIGSCISLPADWSVSELKIACFLRCADACHIDRRRAPSFLYAAINPQGISSIHWQAQNKINKANVKGSKMIFSAGQPFRANEAEAWWLVYELVRVADNEIRSSNALLEESGFRPFTVTRVLGAESPRALAKQILPEGWRPVDAEVRVSDPVGLARSLGGKNLYGQDKLAPVRELLQNAADAIRARRQIEDRPDGWGEISVTVEASEEADAAWLHVDDNGIGMSERVLAGPLIDFGKSIWNSSLLREEFPGVESKVLKPVGKFGIGFFSTFELANDVRVVSRPYNSALSDGKVLEFRGLTSRPLIRQAADKELPRDVFTRVSLRIDDYKAIQTLEPIFHTELFRFRRATNEPFDVALRRLVSTLDIHVKFNDKISGRNFQHEANIYDVHPDVFLDEIYSHFSERSKTIIKDTYASRMRLLKAKDGTVFGRAALVVGDKSDDFHGFVSVGGFLLSAGGGIGVSYIGVVEGEAEGAARRAGIPTVPQEVISNWITEQAQILVEEADRYRKIELLNAAASVLKAGGDPLGLPYCFNRSKLRDYKSTKQYISEIEEIIIPLSQPYSSTLKVRGFDNLRADHFFLEMIDNVFILPNDEQELFPEEMTRLITKEGRTNITRADFSKNVSIIRLFYFMDLVASIWEVQPTLKVGSIQIFKPLVYSPPPPVWALRIIKPRDSGRSDDS